MSTKRSRTPQRAATVAAKKVKELDEDGHDTSDWEPSAESSEADQEELAQDSDDEDDGNVKKEEEKPKTKPAAKTKSAAAPRKKKRKEYVYESDQDEEALPTAARKTVKGGYAHTNKSRAAISKANKGNTPWNKGQNRSESVKAKIAAGVRARNRAILLEKLKRLGLTEEQWMAKKKEIKYLRERVRRAKVAAAKREAKTKGTKKDSSKSKVSNTYLYLQRWAVPLFS